MADLEAMLASGDVSLKTGGVAADIVVAAPLTWASTHRLTLDADRSVIVKSNIVVEGTAGVTITIDSGGELSFATAKSLSFWDASSSLIVNGNSFTLLSSVADLASAMEAAPSGRYALAGDYDASADGAYGASPIQAVFSGTLEGLGHAIAKLTIRDGSDGADTGLFAHIDSGAVRNLRLTAASVLTSQPRQRIGILAGHAVNADIRRMSVTGKLTCQHADSSSIGGLIGYADNGTIANVQTNLRIVFSNKHNPQVGGIAGALVGSALSDSSATGTITQTGTHYSNSVGGLVGSNGGTIERSYATGALTYGSWIGGIAGVNGGTIADSYATGPIAGVSHAGGGAVGFNTGAGTIVRSYATGNVSGAALPGSSVLGGLVGENYPGTIAQSYATGDVIGLSGGWAGGLVGLNVGSISDSFSKGSAAGSDGALVGGLAGANGFKPEKPGTIVRSYSTGAPTADASSLVGGLIGQEVPSSGSASQSYWDTDTSGIGDTSRGSGNVANDPGITGLTTATLQSGLPDGFDPSIWGRSGAINGGLPYLLALPPAP
ncbi:MAG TPA: GLUG motif-containing protein [Rhizomicrobium sp.]|nr:GLUG motif-containing protein [Rhizomicrobium sp.]